MSRLRGAIASVVAFSLWMTPAWGSPGSAPYGTVVTADHARVGSGTVSVGATVYGGDKLFTDVTGSLQVRSGAARFLLSSASDATLSRDGEIPAASLTRGTAIFSTAGSRAFALHVGGAVIRANSDQPTVGQVTVLDARQLTVRSTRGDLSIGVDDDVRVIPAGMAYRIVLNPTPEEFAQAESTQQDQDSRQDDNERNRRKRRGGMPIKAGRSRFIWFAIGITAAVTFFTVYEALESPKKPK